MSEDQKFLEDETLPHDPVFDGAVAIICCAVLDRVEPENFESLTIAMSKYGRERIRFMAHEKTCVWDARNHLAHRFLATDAQYLIFVDNDHLVPCGSSSYFNTRGRVQLPEHIAGKNFIQRMLSHGSDLGIIGASYFDRQVGTQLQCSRGCGSMAEAGFNERYKRGEITGIGEVLWTATGGMRIHRSVFEAIKKNVAKFPEIQPVREGTRWGFFTPNRVGLGEDVAFCHRARQSGFKVWQDYDLRMLHKAHHFN